VPGWDTVVAVAITSVSTLSAAVLTHRFTARRWYEERTDDRRIEQRDAAVALLDAGRVWGPSAVGVGYGVITMRGDLIRLANETEAYERYQEPHREMRRAVTAARLTITEPEVAHAVRLVSMMLDQAGELFASMATEAKKDSNGPSVEAAIQVNRFEVHTTAALDELERVALQAFSVVPGAPGRRSWRRPVWRPWRTRPGSRRKSDAGEVGKAPPFAPDLADAPRHSEEPS
jgi:hypothetical protein